MSEKITKLEVDLSCVQQLKLDLLEMKSKISRFENSAVACDIQLYGVPYNNDENIMSAFGKLCSFLNITQPAVKSAYRIKNRRRELPSNQTIHVKLHTPQNKVDLLVAVAKYQRENGTKLTARNLGFNSDLPVFVNEVLTAENYKILRSATQFKKERYISSVFTRSGLVHVRKFHNTEFVKITSIDELDNLAYSNNSLRDHQIQNSNALAIQNDADQMALDNDECDVNVAAPN